LLPHGWRLLPSYFCGRGCTNDTRFHFRHGLPIGDGMANFKLLIGASLLVAAFGSHAGYAQVTPPAGYTPAVPGGASAFVRTGSSASNSWSWANAAARANGSFNLGGRVITVPAYMRFASNAGRVVGYAIALNPALRVASGVAAFLGLAQIFWDETENKWMQSREVEYDAVTFSVGDSTQHSSATAACHYWADKQNMYQNIPGFTFSVITLSSVKYCYSEKLGGTWGVVSEKNSTVVGYKDFGIDPEQIALEMENHPVPQSIPSILPPGVDIPLEPLPIINPSSDPIPVSQPLRIPLGEPVPVPNTDPQQWKTPVVDIVSAPLMPDQPWRVDVQPKDIIKYDPSPISDPQVVNQEPSGQTSQDKTPGLCEQFPDILACQKPNFDTPDIDQIQTRDASITITPDSGWGADNAACPPARHLPGANVDFEFTTICNFMSGIRPVIIAVAWLMAAMILIGFKRGE